MYAEVAFVAVFRFGRITGFGRRLVVGETGGGVKAMEVGLTRLGRHLWKGGYDGGHGAAEGGRDKRRERRSFTGEFKAGAVRLVLDEGKSISQVARDLDLTASALRLWVAHERADRTKGKTGLTSEERAELSRLRKENRQLRMERDILKKAAAFFAKENA